MNKQSWRDAPVAFNKKFIPGLGKAMSCKYANWCENHPGSTQEERKAANNSIREALVASGKYPSLEEMTEKDGKLRYIDTEAK